MRGRACTPERAQPARAIALNRLYLLEFPCNTIGNRTAVLLYRCFTSGESISKYLRISPFWARYRLFYDSSPQYFAETHCVESFVSSVPTIATFLNLHFCHSYKMFSFAISSFISSRISRALRESPPILRAIAACRACVSLLRWCVVSLLTFCASMNSIRASQA